MHRVDHVDGRALEHALLHAQLLRDELLDGDLGGGGNARGGEGVAVGGGAEAPSCCAAMSDGGRVSVGSELNESCCGMPPPPPAGCACGGGDARIGGASARGDDGADVDSGDDGPGDAA